MKNLVEFLNPINEAYLNNLHDNMDDLENLLTNRLSLLIGENHSLSVSVTGNKIEFSFENDSEYDSEIYSAAGVIIQSYVKSLLNEKKNSEDYFEKDGKFLDELHDLDNGTYSRYDWELGDLVFEIKSFHKFEKSGINISKNQKEQIGPDAIFILIEVEIAKGEILIKDIICRKFSNLKISGKKIVGIK